MVFDILLYWGF